MGRYEKYHLTTEKKLKLINGQEETEHICITIGREDPDTESSNNSDF
jgi:hypothetical protein